MAVAVAASVVALPCCLLLHQHFGNVDCDFHRFWLSVSSFAFSGWRVLKPTPSLSPSSRYSSFSHSSCAPIVLSPTAAEVTAASEETGSS